MSDTLRDAWRDYRLKVIPLRAPPVQATECRRAFYAGAASMLGAIFQILGPDTDDASNEEDARQIDALQAELDRFAADCLEGRA